ncbi:MAG: O-antigen ligase family protein [Allosphingosinicella sp.]
MNARVTGLVASFYLAACLVLGGASAAGAFANGVLQIAGLVLILLVLWRGPAPALPHEARGPAWIWGLFLLVGLLTLIPLAPSIWTGLPYRDTVAEGYRLFGLPLPALPVTLSVHGTIASLLALIPPAAMFLLVLQLPAEQRRMLLWTVLAVAGVSILLGAFQLMGGETSALRLYQITSPHAAVGFFANQNHQATMLLCALPFTGVLAARVATRSGPRSKRSAGAVVSLAVALFLTTGIAISGSAAGYGLFLLSALATVLIYRRAVVGRLGWPWGIGLGVLLAALIVAGLAGPVSTQSLSEEVSEDPASRRVLAETTLDAVGDSFPVGTGLGTFSTVYRQYEEPNRVSRGYANHAHNDYVEIALELGLAGILLVLGFMLWWARQSWRVWRTDFNGAALARSGSVIVGIVLLHSIVDYPIRTAAIAALFAAGCALLVPRAAPARRREPAPDDGAAPLRHLEAD